MGIRKEIGRENSLGRENSMGKLCNLENSDWNLGIQLKNRSDYKGFLKSRDLY